MVRSTLPCSRLLIAPPHQRTDALARWRTDRSKARLQLWLLLQQKLQPSWARVSGHEHGCHV